MAPGAKNPFMAGSGKVNAFRKPSGLNKPRATNFWREYITKCADCGLVEKHKSGFLFTCMNPEGVMLTFCNVNCCTKWEETGDNTNSRREAIKAQKAKKNGV